MTIKGREEFAIKLVEVCAIKRRIESSIKREESAIT